MLFRSIPDVAISERMFEIACNRKKATREILSYIRFHKDLPQMAAIEEFSAKMAKYTLLTNKGNNIFSDYYDTAEDILYEIRKRRKFYY